MGKKKDAVYLGVCLSAATHEELKKLAAEKELSMSTLVLRRREIRARGENGE